MVLGEQGEGGDQRIILDRLCRRCGDRRGQRERLVPGENVNGDACSDDDEENQRRQPGRSGRVQAVGQQQKERNAAKGDTCAGDRSGQRQKNDARNHDYSGRSRAITFA